jgi:hypothetical protein
VRVFLSLELFIAFWRPENTTIQTFGASFFKEETMRSLKSGLLLFVWLGLGLLLSAPPTLACGGLFCQNVPVDQSAERIIFTVDAGTISAYVQINYTGNAPDFAWVVPVPSVPEVDVAEMSSFNELQTATDPVFMLPPVPNCLMDRMPVMESAAGGGVTVFSSGEAGPYAYDVVGAEAGNADALIAWLNENKYRITPEMEPLVHVYVDEGMVFLAMKLRPDQGVQDIQPVKMTYQSQRPMIPLRLTAVAANPNMGVYTWIFGRAQAEPQNYAKLEVSDNDLSAGSFGSGTDYLQQVGLGIDRYEGKAFITEYAQPTSQLNVTDPLLRELRQRYPYVTRLYGQISPEEMTVDPVFDFNNNLPDISNVHDLTARTNMYPCRDDAVNVEVPTLFENQNGSSTTNLAIPYLALGAIGATCLLGIGAAIGGGVIFLMKRK